MQRKTITLEDGCASLFISYIVYYFNMEYFVDMLREGYLYILQDYVSVWVRKSCFFSRDSSATSYFYKIVNESTELHCVSNMTYVTRPNVCGHLNHKPITDCRTSHVKEGLDTCGITQIPFKIQAAAV